MHDTLVIQSHTNPLPYSWLEPCLSSVRNWSESQNYDYRFIGDELFDVLPGYIINKTKKQRVIATDLARLYLLQAGLNEAYKTVVWMDADFLIFNPDEFVLPDSSYALGREVWIQYDKNNKLKAYKKVHNAFMMFRQGNPFLEFYLDTAIRLVQLNNGVMPPQFIGPKLLAALHNIVIFPVLESAGMLSPMVIKDLLHKDDGDRKSIQLFLDNSTDVITSANLCISSCLNEEISALDMKEVINLLLTQGIRPSES